MLTLLLIGRLGPRPLRAPPKSVRPLAGGLLALTLLIGLTASAPLRAQPAPLVHDPTPRTVPLGSVQDGETRIDVALDANGDGWVAWRRREGGGPNNRYAILIRRLEDGLPTGPERLVATAVDRLTGSAELGVVRVATELSGDCAVVWDESDPVSGLFRVQLRLWSAADGAFTPARTLSPSSPPENHILPDVALSSPAGSPAAAYVTWQRGTAQGSSTILLADLQRSAFGTGSPALSALQVRDASRRPTGSNDIQERPAIAADAQGRVTIAWRRFTEWFPGITAWAPVVRQWQGGSFLPIRAPLLSASVDEWIANTSTDFMEPDGRLFPVRIASSRSGLTVIGWRAPTGPFFRLARLEAPYASGPPAQGFVAQPIATAAFVGGTAQHDLSLDAEGTVQWLWFGSNFRNGTTVLGTWLSRMDPVAGVELEQLRLTRRVGFGLSAASAASGRVVTGIASSAPNRPTLFRALKPAFQALTGPADPTLRLRLALPGRAGEAYRIWPQAGLGPAPGLALADGRRARVDPLDPLFLATTTGLYAPFLPGLSGRLDAAGEAILDIPLTPARRPIAFGLTVFTADPTRPLPDGIPILVPPRLRLWQ